MYYSLNTVANFLQLIAMISITANLISAKGAYVISWEAVFNFNNILSHLYVGMDLRCNGIYIY